MVKMKEEEKEEKTVGIYGDILESILSNVPLVELASAASLVSTEWKAAVSSSLRHLNPAKPWLFIHTQATRTPYSTTTRAYDTRSQSWLQIHRPSIKHVSTLRSAHSGILYMLSPSTLSFSSDPFHLTWHHAHSPFLWRTDPILALVGNKLIVAGGGCDFEDDPLAVEIYDVNTRTWDSCEFMPYVLKDSAASTWLSVATDGRLMFVVERQSSSVGLGGVNHVILHTFDPESNKWTGRPFRIQPEPDIDESWPVSSCSSIIITYNYRSGRLILIGIIGKGQGQGLKLWSVDPESMEMEEIGEMPKDMFERSGNFFSTSSSSSSSSSSPSSISACSASNWVYIYNNPNPYNNYNSNSKSNCELGEVYVCEILENDGCRWKKEEIPQPQPPPPTSLVENENSMSPCGWGWGWGWGERVVFTCSDVSIEDVKEALRTTNWKCDPISSMEYGL